MSEKVTEYSAEYAPVPTPSAEQAPRDEADKQIEQTPEQYPKVDTDALRKQAEQQAISAKEVNLAEHDSTPASSSSSIGLYKQLKDDAYRRILSKTRQRLSAADRTLSAIIHQPMVEKLSNGAARTLGRPSGLLAGGLVAVIGSTLHIYFSRKYGFEYNYLVFFGLIAIGFLLGTAIELLAHIIRKR